MDGLEGINSEERMAHRIRKVDESAGQYLKVQMEELQWGFPIATTLSLNKLTQINGKEK